MSDDVTKAATAVASSVLLWPVLFGVIFIWLLKADRNTELDSTNGRGFGGATRYPITLGAENSDVNTARAAFTGFGFFGNGDGHVELYHANIPQARYCARYDARLSRHLWSNQSLVGVFGLLNSEQNRVDAGRNKLLEVHI